MQKDIRAYASNYMEDFGFEAEMVHYRRKLALERLAFHKPKTVIEVGCGLESTLETWAKDGGTWSRWTIIEPAPNFAQAARNMIARLRLSGVDVKESFFEESDLTGAAPDLILCAGLLHEVPSASDMILALADAMGPETILHVSVPNARSLHRRLAQAMGLIDELSAMSIRNKKLMQYRVYDSFSLENDLIIGGLRIIESGGILIKPFTHKQMEQIKDILDRSMLDGLDVLGRNHPEWASEIWAEAVRT